MNISCNNSNFTTFQTIAQTSRTTGLSQYFLRGLKKEGRLPHVISGNRVMVDVPELLTQLREQQTRCE